MTPTEKIVEALNEAFDDDQNAMHALVNNRIPCNDQMARRSLLVCSKNVTADGWSIGAMGLLNGALLAADMPIVAIKFSEPDKSGRSRIVGFQVYPYDVPIGEEGELKMETKGDDDE